VADADRAGDIIGRIRDHIKKAPPRKDRFDLNEAINEVIVLARSTITENGVSVQIRLAEGRLPVHGDRTQLRQVVLNLILNALEAMSSVEAGARELLISTKQSETNGIVAAVGDSGPGIDAENLERIFEAFYTTKSSGLGIGLAICRSIIEAMGAGCGRIRTNREARSFSSPCPVRKMSLRIESRAEASFQLLVVDWFAKITDNSFLQSAGARLVIGIGCHQDRRNRAPRLGEVPVKFDSRHGRHLDVSDQAGGFDESRCC
jgi:nitrogen-specific signal transduction histidine kinase